MMFNYYFDSQNRVYYKWGTNENREHVFYSLCNNEWSEICICDNGRKTGFGWEYDIQRSDTDRTTLSTFNDLSSIVLTITTTSRSTLSVTNRYIKLELVDKQSVPFQDETAKYSGRTISQKPAPTTQPSTRLKTYELTPNQKEKLIQHKKMLEQRWFERRIHDYLFFCQGRTKTEKITELTKLLNGEACDPDVVEQGRTGKILGSV
ncbi:MULTISPECIES: hypothetical protein [unclassified Legionella]|uniref:hypothetical protein n=1 Tax=unclassified Legionella TaxID=2622702 RepID=UPI001055C5F8|nr:MULTISPECIES: hypothetical protein [unclassified Legionella]MDI9817958.1 hypothetical protein [Legionella sp. PL877]